MMQKHIDQDILDHYVIEDFDNFQVDTIKKCYHIETGDEFIFETYQILPKLAKSIKGEINSIYQLDHPSILRLHEAFEGRNKVSLVYQSFDRDAKTLLEYLQNEVSSCLNEERASIIIFRIISSMMYHHSKNIVHLNLRLDNIFLPDIKILNDIKITNFGASNSSSNLRFQFHKAKKYDLFSIGLIAYGLVTGIIISPSSSNHDEISPPFLQNNESFQLLSSSCKDFILTCLEAPKNTNIDTVLLRSHSWLRNSCPQKEEILSSTYFTLIAFKKMPLISKVLRYIVSHSITDKQCNNSRTEFMKFDLEGHGEITIDNFTTILRRTSTLDTLEIRDIFNAINITQSNNIRYSEFIAAMLHENDITIKCLEKIFLRLSHGCEHFTMDDLQLVLGDSFTRGYFEDIYNEVGLRPFSVTTFPQFKGLLFTKSRKLMEYNNMCSRNTQILHDHPTDLSQDNTNNNDLTLAINASNRSSGTINQTVITSSLSSVVKEDTMKADLFDVYSVEKETILGSGANGGVVRCTHRISGIQYALKTLNKSKYSGSKKDTWKHELEIMAQLDHPNILRLHEFFETDTKIYIILELCTGGDLLEKLNNLPGRSFSEVVACKYIRDILRAIRYCHDHHVVHRDLKLDNILIEENCTSSSASTMKLIDFGLAYFFTKSSTGNATMNDPVGTPYYVAPEVISKCYNEKCDIWSLGVITYMLLTGNPPFNGDNEAEILKQVKRKEAKLRRSDFNFSISDSAISFMRLCLTKNSSERMSAEEAQKHPWFHILTSQHHELQFQFQIHSNKQILSPKIVDRLKNFPRKDPIVRLFMETLSHTLLVEDQLEVRHEFFKVDVEEAGEISYASWVVAMAMKPSTRSFHCLMSEREAATVFTQIDGGRTGKIKYHQFLAATLLPREMKEAQLKLAFDCVARHNAFITANDLMTALLSSNIITRQEIDNLNKDIIYPSLQLSYLNFVDIVLEHYTIYDWKLQQQQFFSDNKILSKVRPVLNIPNSIFTVSTSSTSSYSASPMSTAMRKSYSVNQLNGDISVCASDSDSASTSPDYRRLPPITYPITMKTKVTDEKLINKEISLMTNTITPTLNSSRDATSMSMSPPSRYSNISLLSSSSSSSSYNLIPKSFGLRKRISETSPTTNMQSQQQQLSSLSRSISFNNNPGSGSVTESNISPNRLLMPSLERFYRRNQTPSPPSPT